MFFVPSVSAVDTVGGAAATPLGGESSSSHGAMGAGTGASVGRTTAEHERHMRGGQITILVSNMRLPSDEDDTESSDSVGVSIVIDDGEKMTPIHPLRTRTSSVTSSLPSPAVTGASCSLGV